MTATKFMAIYSSTKKMLRRKVIFATKCYGAMFMEWWMTDEDYLHQAYLCPGEEMVLVDVHYWWQGQEVQHAAIGRAIYEKHGVYAILPGDPIGRCAVFHPLTGLVNNVIMADDELDMVKGRLLKNDPFVSIGDVYDFSTKKFITPLSVPDRRKMLMSSTCLLLAA